MLSREQARISQVCASRDRTGPGLYSASSLAVVQTRGATKLRRTETGETAERGRRVAPQPNLSAAL